MLVEPDPSSAVVYIVDDELAMRDSLSGLLRSVGLNCQSFVGTRDFMTSVRDPVPSCLLLDVRLRGESGLMFQQQSRAEAAMPIVFMTGYADIEMCKKAMKSGAHDFLVKPFGEQEVIEAVMGALEIDARRLVEAHAKSALLDSYATLTAREREVLGHVVGGALNKTIASRMSISEVTVKLHRGSAMRKMQAKSLADLIHKSQALGLMFDGA